MALYELKEATLGGVEGEGYAFVIDTYQGKAYKGVFFAHDDAAPIEAVAENQEPISFEGTVYHKTTEKVETLDVNVTKTVGAAIGTRADFEVVDS